MQPLRSGGRWGRQQVLACASKSGPAPLLCLTSHLLRRSLELYSLSESVIDTWFGVHIRLVRLLPFCAPCAYLGAHPSSAPLQR